MCIYTMGPPKATFLVVFMVNNLVSSWPKPFFSWFWGSWDRYIYIYATVLCIRTGPVSGFVAKRTFNRLLQLTSISNWHPSGRFKQLRDVVDWLAGCAGGELESPFLKGPPKTQRCEKETKVLDVFFFFGGVHRYQVNQSAFIILSLHFFNNHVFLLGEFTSRVRLGKTTAAVKRVFNGDLELAIIVKAA